MTNARLALRHPLDGYYPIVEAFIAQPSLLADYWRCRHVLLLCSYQGTLYCDQDSNDQLISYLFNSFDQDLLFGSVTEDSSQLRDQITLSRLWDRCNPALQESAPITSRPANTDLEVAN